VIACLGLIGVLLASAWRAGNAGPYISPVGDRVVASAVPSPPATSAPAGEHRYLTRVSDDGRYFLDQTGDPYLVRGDSPWSLLTDVAPEDAERYFENREATGFNAAIVSLVGAVANGAPSDDGSTFDGLLPFVAGDVTRWNEPYWQRVDSYVQMAADHGITLFVYPMDGWNITRVFADVSLDESARYGTMVAQRFARFSNIVWMVGGDYFPVTNEPERGSENDHRMAAMLDGIRSAGDQRAASIQLGYNRSFSTENPFWGPRVDFNFVYTYFPTYEAVLVAYKSAPVPALFAEGNYVGENNQGDTPDTTTETLRRQVLWALTSGSPGDFAGTDDWEFHDGWQDRLRTDQLDQIRRLRDLFAGMPWWQLVPDKGSDLLLEGRGEMIRPGEEMDVLDNDAATVARAESGDLAVVYLPTLREITLDRGKLAPGVTATWVDPASGERTDAGGADKLRPSGRNAGGDEDWLLILSARH
jgi:hypothetical protein